MTSASLRPPPRSQSPPGRVPKGPVGKNSTIFGTYRVERPSSTSEL